MLAIFDHLIAKKLSEFPRHSGGMDESVMKELKSDLAGLLDKYNNLLDKVQKYEKMLNEHDEEINRIIRACDSKANRQEMIDLNKKVSTAII